MGAGTVSLWFIKIIFCVIECENIDYVKVFVVSQDQNALKHCQEECPKEKPMKHLILIKFLNTESLTTLKQMTPIKTENHIWINCCVT